MGGGGDGDLGFAGSIPAIYDRYLVPLIFEPYALDVATRVEAMAPGSVLEVAAGTGAVTRELAARLPDDVVITATDLNQPMLDHAAAQGTTRPVVWRQADVMALPFDDESFDVVVCQFGAMFFPDRPAAFAEVARVLRPGGRFVFNVWGRIDDNELIEVIAEAVGSAFGEDPPEFMSRVPYGYHDAELIAADLAAGGFTEPAQIDGLE